MHKLLVVSLFCAVIASCLAAPSRLTREFRFTGASGSLKGRQNQTTESRTQQFGSSNFQSQSFTNGAGLSDNDFDLESFIGFGKLPERKEKSAQVPEISKPPKQPIVESESLAAANEGAVSAGSVSGITAGKDLGSLDLDSFAGVNEKEGYGHSSSRAVGNKVTHRRLVKKPQVEENREVQGDQAGDLSVATVGASATVVKKKASTKENEDGSDSFWDNFFVSASHLSTGSAGNSKITGSLGGFGGDSGSFGITFEDNEEE